jgi:hypothetical protein
LAQEKLEIARSKAKPYEGSPDVMKIHLAGCMYWESRLKRMMGEDGRANDLLREACELATEIGYWRAKPWTDELGGE